MKRCSEMYCPLSYDQNKETFWNLIIYGNNNGYTGLHPKLTAKVSQLSRMFDQITKTSDNLPIYWKFHTCFQYNIDEKEYDESIVKGKDLFIEKFNHIKDITNQCKLIIGDNTSNDELSTDQNEKLYDLLDPIQDILLKPHANCLAQYYLAFIHDYYYTGHDALGFYDFEEDEDNDFALIYFKLAAKNGEVRAQARLGDCLADKNKSFKYSKMAADQGDSYGQYLLGHHYEHGFGVTQNLVEAYKFYKLAGRLEDMDIIKQKIKAIVGSIL